MEDKIKNAKDLKAGDKIYYYHRGKIYERTIAEINWDQCYIVCLTKGGKSLTERLKLYSAGLYIEDSKGILYVQYTKHYTCPESIKKYIRCDIDIELSHVDYYKKKVEFHRKRAFNKARSLNRFIDKN